MFILYNLLQFLFLVIFCPFIIIFVLCSPKYRDRIPARLGLGLRKKIASTLNSGEQSPIFWIHALSVGETTSAEPLIHGLRHQFPQCKIIFSVTTKSGKEVADLRLTHQVDVVLDGPLDILPVVLYFQKMIQPDCFILVETDFWPNNLLLLQNKKIPTMLVNGRVSEKSIIGYRRMSFFFSPMFKSLSALCMQTNGDKKKIESLGLPPEKVLTLGNLKFDTPELHFEKKGAMLKHYLPEDKVIFICGSTHPGEEELLISSYVKVRGEFPEVFLIIAPRNVKRAEEIQNIATTHSLTVSMRTEMNHNPSDIFILNTIGELAVCYSLAKIAFVGGSLVAKGGHNPIEPASMGIPVLFGPHMEDFSEIAESLVQCHGGKTIKTQEDLCQSLKTLLQSPEILRNNGKAAKHFVDNHRGVIDKHLTLIHTLL
ncbi:MAG: 3-deoxy-D-manno-octulosonic-acid transferase [Desulforhopalus sp.]|jgi:3-deoxy-D-manno-octulosonic-acid transferase